jgi:glycosyltransferase involved in cell wall biosynthesis
MSLSIIIVNYKSTRLVLDCLAMIDQDPSAPDFEIIVVDNASGGDPRTPILTAFPRVTWIQMEYNSGFARANNEGIRRSTGETVLLLNSDTLPAAGMIAACYQGLLQSEYVAAGVQLSNSDGTPQISGNYFMKGGLNYLLPLPYMGKAIKWMGERMKVKKPHVPDGAVVTIHGAAAASSGSGTSSVAAETGPVIEVDWIGALTVVHLQGETANQEFGSAGKGYYNLYDRKGLQIMLSNFVRIRKQFGTGWFLVQLFFYLLEIPVFFIGVLLSALFTRKQDRYSFTQFINYCKNIGALLGKSALIIRNKPYFYKVL